MDAFTDARDVGRFLKVRIQESGLLIKDVAEKIGTDPSYLSHMLSGRVSVGESEYFGPLVQVLGLSVDEVRAINPSAVIAVQPPEALDVKQPGYHPEPLLQPRVIPHWGSVGAGLNPGAYAHAHPTMRRFPYIPALEGYRDEDLFTLDVIGDSMACAEVQNEIREGSIAIFHARLEPQLGDIVAVWLEQEQKGVLKLLTQDKGHVVLRSYNDHHKPIILSPDDRDYIQGVYITHIPPGRRAKSVKFRK